MIASALRITILILAAVCLLCRCRLSPEPLPGSRNDEGPHMQFCYLFIAESGEQLGGSPSQQDIVYVSIDGTVQASQEMSSDLILGLGEGTLDTSTLFAMLEKSEFPRQRGLSILDLLQPAVETEWSGPSLDIEAGRCDGRSSRWVGSPKEVPHPLSPLVSEVRALRAQVKQETPEAGQGYVRAQLLGTVNARELRRAGLVVDVTDEQLEANPTLVDALSRVRKLIAVPEGLEDYSGIEASFTRELSLHVARGKDVYQVRYLTSAGSNR